MSRCGYSRSAEPGISAKFLANHQLQARPDLINCTDLDIDQPAGWQHDLSNDVFGHISLDLARPLWPGDPNHAIRCDRIDQTGKAGGEVGLADDEDQHQITMTGQSVADCHTIRQLAEDALDFGWRFDYRDRHTGLDAQLLWQWCARIAECHY